MSSPLTSAQARVAARNTSRRFPRRPHLLGSSVETAVERRKHPNNDGGRSTEGVPARPVQGALHRASSEGTGGALFAGRRSGTLSEPSSDDFPMDDDEEEEDEDIMQDEVSADLCAAPVQ